MAEHIKCGAAMRAILREGKVEGLIAWFFAYRVVDWQLRAVLQ